MELRKARTQDYVEVTKMFIDFLTESYPDRSVTSEISCYKLVMSWFEQNSDIVLAIKDSTIIGFTLAYIDTNGGTLSAVYRAEIAYVKPEFRYTRAAYLLMINVIKLAQTHNLSVVSKGTMYNNVHKLHAKLGATPLFTEALIK